MLPTTQRFLLFLLRPFIVFLILSVLVGIYFPSFLAIVMINPWLNGTILGITFLGLGTLISEMLSMYGEFKYLEAHQPQKLRIFPNPAFYLSFPILQWYQSGMHIDAKLPLSQCEKRLAQRLRFGQFLAGTLVFAGLLGTLWGLSQSIIVMADMFQHSITDGSGKGDFLMIVRDHLSDALSKMGLAFSSSLLGLGGSVLLHFFLMQLRVLQGQWYDQIVRWVQDSLNNKSSTDLARRASLDETFTPDVMVPLLNRIFVSLDGFSLTHKAQLQRCQDLTECFLSFSAKVQDLSELMKGQHHILNKWAQEQMTSRHALEVMGQKLEDLGFSGDEAIRHALTKITVCCEFLARQQGYDSPPNTTL
ncbi:hypothetical protein [Holospora curviuscula]|uniref:MotA/TolQ/ExbB proton channel domain-containing protein n=1 Tax=Holospora curviuscula TaxID=1082868 RepID=A0A2S5RAC7_9PROT|nr:hypothetical protein [Holospora curviuscula]PPE04253.1 hypothetical protein HCUR_00444 [Holospora curviuscula]